MVGELELFYRFMCQYADFLDEMAAAEDRKYQALICADPHRMDKAIAEMQANIMRLDKLEVQRQQLQAEAGLGDLSFREMIDHLKAEDKPAFKVLFERFSRTAEMIQQSNAKSMSYAEMNLSLSDMLPKDALQETTYTSAGSKTTGEGGQAGSVFETKI
jgi:uncharacterized protein YdcH (DUF465 family)